MDSFAGLRRRFLPRMVKSQKRLERFWTDNSWSQRDACTDCRHKTTGFSRLIWCRWRDSNSHALWAQTPEACVSTNSTTSALCFRYCVNMACSITTKKNPSTDKTENKSVCAINQLHKLWAQKNRHLPVDLVQMERLELSRLVGTNT